MAGDKPPDGVDHDMNLAHQAASGSPERLSTSLFLPLLKFEWVVQ